MMEDKQIGVPTNVAVFIDYEYVIPSSRNTLQRFHSFATIS